MEKIYSMLDLSPDPEKEMNKPSSRPEEQFNIQKILDFLHKNGDMYKIWQDITHNHNHKKRLTAQEIWSLVVDVRHRLRDVQQSMDTKIDRFEEAYTSISGQKQYITWLKSLVGYLLHIFDTERQNKTQRTEAAQVNAALLKMLWQDRKTVLHAFVDLINTWIGEEKWLSVYQLQIEALIKIKEKFPYIWNVASDADLLDALIRKYNLLMAKNKPDDV